MKKLSLFLTLAVFFCTASVQASFSLSEPVSNSSKDSAVEKEVIPDNAVVTDALHEFKSLTRVERKMRISEAKKTWKEYKAAKKAGTSEPSTNTILLAILAILLPPLAVYLHEGVINGKFWLDLLLTLLFYLPGMIYALIVVLG